MWLHLVHKYPITLIHKGGFNIVKITSIYCRYWGRGDVRYEGFIGIGEYIIGYLVKIKGI